VKTSENMFHLGERRPVSVPPITLPPDSASLVALDDEHAAEVRILRDGRAAWQAIGKADTFENWCVIGRALQIGKISALRVSGANRAMGRTYSLAFHQWAKEHGFHRMNKSVRSVSIELAENLQAITEWRATLTEKQRRRLVHPLSNVRGWQRATGQFAKQRNIAEEAQQALRRLLSLIAHLPAAQAESLKQAARTALCL
jgi:hypothetical protein